MGVKGTSLVQADFGRSVEREENFCYVFAVLARRVGGLRFLVAGAELPLGDFCFCGDCVKAAAELPHSKFKNVLRRKGVTARVSGLFCMRFESD